MKYQTFAFASLMLISTGSANSFPLQPLGSGTQIKSEILKIDTNSDQCNGIRAKLAEVQDSRDAYNGYESNWSLKDEIAELDIQIDQLNDELAENNC